MALQVPCEVWPPTLFLPWRPQTLSLDPGTWGFPLEDPSTAIHFQGTAPGLGGQKMAQPDSCTNVNTLKGGRKDPCPETASSSGVTLLKPPPHPRSPSHTSTISLQVQVPPGGLAGDCLTLGWPRTWCQKRVPGWDGGSRERWVCTQSCLTLCDPMSWSPPGSPVHEDSPGRNTGVGCHFLQ